MKVKKFFFNDNECYFITTDSGVPVTDACRYLKSLWLNNVSNSTIASKAYDLALYFEYLDEFKINHLKVNNNNIIDSLALSLPEYDSNLMYSNHINGTMPAGDRKKIFDDFTRSEFGIISNARCLTEGVDVPIIDAVYFADPKKGRNYSTYSRR